MLAPSIWLDKNGCDGEKVSLFTIAFNCTRNHA